MLTGELKNKIDRIWDAFWSGGISNPLETGRAKDKARLLQFVEEGALDPDRFEAILIRHGLMDRWKLFERQFLREQP